MDDGAQASVIAHTYVRLKPGYGESLMSVWNQRPVTPAILAPATILANADNESEELTIAVSACLHCLRVRGHYKLEELSPHAMQFYLAYSYSLEMRDANGHSQYIQNMRDRAGANEARAIFAGAHAGLVAMGATAQADTLHKMIVLADANPESADEQTGFEDGRAEALELLDDAFDEAEESDPIIKWAAAWIQGWSDLRPVEDAGFEAACVALAMANPKRLTRISASRIEKFHKAATDPFRVCLGLAAAAAEEPEIVVRVISRHEITINGELDIAWLIQTERGLRYSMADLAGVAVYEVIHTAEDDGPITQAHIGAVIGRIPNEEVDAFRASVADRPVAAAADLLMRRARHDSENAVLSTARLVRNTSWFDRMLGRAHASLIFYLIDADEMFMMSETKEGFVLVSMDNNEVHGPVSDAEAEQHAKDVRE